MNLHASHLNGKLWTDAALDGLKDGLWSIPVLFVAYLLMELLERSNRLNESTLRRYSRRAGPALGGLLGVLNVGLNIVGNLAAIYNLGFGTAKNVVNDTYGDSTKFEF